MNQSTQSRLTVLLVTDIVGSTDLKSRIGLGNYARLLEQHDSLFKRLIAKFASAEILKDTGDGYFTSFPTTSDAVRFALHFQQELQEATWNPERALRVRVGIHVGEVAQMEREQTGKPKLVGLAADVVTRVANLAEGGQILLTRFAFNEARQFVSSAELRWIAHGEYRLRGHEEPLEIFEVGVEPIAPLRAPAGTGADARRAVSLDEEETLGWRPAVGLPVPERAHWVLDRKIGEGGFGEVWLAKHEKLHTPRVFKFCFDADRLRSLKREIALFRLLRETLGDRKDIARLHEVKIDHPPYFLESEYTEGGNLEDWATAQGGLDRVPLNTRLQIVAGVADAVAAAHSVGVLHKDLKPSNVLIASSDSGDGTPQPRLADFGIGIITDRARLREREITETSFTQMTRDTSSQTGTRLYAPPEVLVGRPFTVQGDIYALGVLLYQMVVADLHRPLAEGWERDVEDELLREDIAACVEGDPNRRLASASELAKRLLALPHRRQWKQREQEQARAARRRQRAFRGAIYASIAMVLLLAMVAAIALRERRLRAEAEALRASEAKQRAVAKGVSDFLDRMLTSANPDEGIGKDVTVLQVLDAAEKDLAGAQQRGEPEVEAAVLKTLGSTYRTLGESARAEALLRRSLEMTTKLKGPDHPDVFAIRSVLALTLADQAKYEEADGLFRDAIAGLVRTLGTENDTTLTHQLNYAEMMVRQGRLDEAEPMIRRVVEIESRLHGPESGQAIMAMSTLVGSLFRHGSFIEGAPIAKKVYEARQRLYGDEHALTLMAMNDYGTMMLRLGHPEEAEPLFCKLVDLERKSVGESHPRTLAAMQNLSTTLDALDKKPESLELSRKVFELRKQTQGPDHPDTLFAEKDLASSLIDAGKGEEAIAMLKSIIQIQRNKLGETNSETLDSVNTLCFALVTLGRYDEAEPLFHSTIETGTKYLGTTHPQVISYRLNYAGALMKEERYPESEQQHLKIWEDVQKDPNVPAATRSRVASRLAKLYRVWRKPEEAAKYTALSIAATQPAATAPTTAAASR
jgi:serine/threonine-protein kinase